MSAQIPFKITTLIVTDSNGDKSFRDGNDSPREKVDSQLEIMHKQTLATGRKSSAHNCTWEIRTTKPNTSSDFVPMHSELKISSS